MYSLFSSRGAEGSIALHLDLELGDDALKLAPNVSGCIHPYHEEHFEDRLRPHSIMYEILRNWRMSELFESRDISS